MAIAAERVEDLRAKVRGGVVGRDDSEYEGARALHNAMIDRRPALITRCTDAADVIAAVTFARDSGLELAIRGGAHNGAGLASVDDGLVIDLSRMRGVVVDPDKRSAVVLGGSLLGDVDHATYPFGLARCRSASSRRPASAGSRSAAVWGISPARSASRLTASSAPTSCWRTGASCGRARRKTRISFGRCAAAAATSAS
jgi:FAD binding domain